MNPWKPLETPGLNETPGLHSHCKEKVASDLEGEGDWGEKNIQFKIAVVLSTSVFSLY